MEIQYRAAHRPGTNGIVERNHRQIKSYAAKSNSSIHETLYWYNCVSKKNGQRPCILKYQACDWRKPWFLDKSAPSGMISASKKCLEPWKPDVKWNWRRANQSPEKHNTRAQRRQ